MQFETASPAKTTSPPFRGPLAEVLAMAWKNAQDPTDVRSMMFAMAELARGTPRPPPLLGATEDGHLIDWKDEDGNDQHLDIGKMQSFMRTIRKHAEKQNTEADISRHSET
jgi:hypothetical protein